MPLIETVLSLLSPHECLVCRREGKLLCGSCLNLEVMPVPSRCYRCHKASKDSAVCITCRRKVALRHVWVRTLYVPPASELVLKFKYERARAAYYPIAAALADALPLFHKDTLLVAVPTATSRIRRRGYDHAILVVRRLSALTGLMHITPAIRSGQTHQFGSSRTKRIHQLDRAFRVVNPRQIKNKRILLVDDVLTTGATLETLAGVFKKAGAKHIDAVVFAQKL